MKIKSLTITSSFKYLWLKKIVGVDLMQHCAKCLLGEYIKGISPSIKSYENIELSDDIYYLCGVSLPFVYENNFHCAFKHKPGSTFVYTSNGVELIVEDGEKLPISEASINTMHPKAQFRSYNTCRNWMFAHYLNNSNLL